MRDCLGTVFLIAWIVSIFVGYHIIPAHHWFIAVPIGCFLSLASVIAPVSGENHNAHFRANRRR